MGRTRPRRGCSLHRPLALEKPNRPWKAAGALPHVHSAGTFTAVEVCRTTPKFNQTGANLEKRALQSGPEPETSKRRKKPRSRLCWWPTTLMVGVVCFDTDIRCALGSLRRHIPTEEPRPHWRWLPANSPGLNFPVSRTRLDFHFISHGKRHSPERSLGAWTCGLAPRPGI